VSRAQSRRRGGKRAARKPSRREARREQAPDLVTARAPEPEEPPSAPAAGTPGRGHRLGTTGWLLAVLGSAALLGVGLVGELGTWVADVGAVATSTAYTWGLAARTGGRPLLFSSFALALGVLVVVLDTDPLRSGAAVVTAVLAAVFAVMATVPAVHFAGAVRETGVALVIASIGAMATLAWAPVVNLERFEYTVLGLSFVSAFVMVYRLGAGFHGLGSRGVLTVVLGGVILALTLGYAELLRRYGTADLVETLDDAVRWSHHHLGAFPRPIIALLGVPALTWGTHMRARRRQGWWVCAFGVAVTAPVAYGLVDPGRSVLEVSLAAAYGVLIGLVLGYLLIRADLRFTGPRGRRLKETEEATAVRPEPGRTHALW
jgi:hypothetical protein